MAQSYILEDLFILVDKIFLRKFEPMKSALL